MKIGNWCLLALTIAILISGIQLEATHSIGLPSAWIQILIGVLFMGMAAYHVYLHFGRSNRFSKFKKQKSQVTRILWWVALVTLVSGVVAMIH